jgi:serine/threonine protein phosphatase PrpC
VTDVAAGVFSMPFGVTSFAFREGASMALRLIAGSKTDVGLQREQNEDSCFASVPADGVPGSGLFIVADGMGGYHAGEVASRLAVETIRDTLSPLIGPASGQPTVPLTRDQKKAEKGRRGKEGKDARDPNKTQPLPELGANGATQPTGAATQRLDESVALEHYADRVRDAVEAANDALIAYGREHSDSREMGSTVTAALVVSGRAFIANVGDSRTYLFSDDKLTRVTRDHSLVERLVEAGQIDPADVYDHPNRNLIYRSLSATTRSNVEVDIFMEQLKAGDSLLLCSDGAWEMVRDEQIASILRETADPQRAAELLVERANEHGGEDNITVVLARCLEA